jgi:hypothetical protein
MSGLRNRRERWRFGVAGSAATAVDVAVNEDCEQRTTPKRRAQQVP